MYRLTLTKCNLQQEGEYSVVATNSVGSSNKKCKLYVIEPIKILENLDNVVAKEEDAVLLSLKSEKNNKSKFIQIEWFYNGKKIESESQDTYVIENVEDDNFSLHTLKIMRVQCLLHEGTYHARLRNDAGLLTITNKIKLEINYKPKFLIKPEDQKIKLDSTPLQLIYKIESKPNAETIW